MRTSSLLIAATTSTLIALTGCSAAGPLDDQGPSQPSVSSSPAVRTPAPSADFPTQSTDPVTPGGPADAGTRTVKPGRHDKEIARTTRDGSQHSGRVSDPSKSDAQKDRWTIEAACSTAVGQLHSATAQYTVTALEDTRHPSSRVIAADTLICTSTPIRVRDVRLDGRNVSIDITSGGTAVSSSYGLVYPTR